MFSGRVVIMPLIRYEPDPEVNNLYDYLKTWSRVGAVATTAASLLHLGEEVSNNRTNSLVPDDTCHHVQTARTDARV
jgi:hypothetical protein